MEKVIFNKYPTYKPSGVEWLGEIPSRWEILPGLSFIYENKDRNKGMKRNTILSLSYGNIRVKGEDELTGLVPESFETYQFVNKGDLIFRPTDLQNDTVSLRSSISEYEGIITNAYLNLRFTPKSNSKFFHYFFRAIDNNKIIYGLGSGLRQNISYLDFRRFNFPFPPLPEQTAIATFLDHKTALIDKAIGIKEKQIELLKEHRQILINKAVTRGLNPNVKMKDSGVEWIGEIPEHWKVKKLKHVAGNFMYGTSIDCNELESGTPVLRIPNIGELYINFEGLKYALLTESETKNYLLQKNDILIVRTNGNPSLVGKSAMFSGEGDYMFASYLIRVKPKENIEAKFLINTMNSFSMRGSLTYSARTSAGNYNLNTQSLGDCYLAYPPKDEQQGIIEFIEIANSKITSTITLKEQEIEKLKEYKATLINSAVTGKIKVC